MNRAFVAFAALTACGGDGPPAASPSIDAGSPPPPVDAGSCAPHGLFGVPSEVPGLYAPGQSVASARFADDGLSAIVTRGSPPKLYVATRKTTTEPFVVGAEIASGAHGTLADGGRTLFFEGSDGDIHVAKRSAVTGPFGAPEIAPGVSTPARERHPFFVADALYFEREDAGVVRIVRARWTGTTFEGETEVAGFTGARAPAVSRPQDRLFVVKDAKLYVTTRTTDPGYVFAGFFPLDNLSTGSEEPVDVSPDGCILYFSRETGGERRIFSARRSN